MYECNTGRRQAERKLTTMLIKGLAEHRRVVGPDPGVLLRLAGQTPPVIHKGQVIVDPIGYRLGVYENYGPNGCIGWGGRASPEERNTAEWVVHDDAITRLVEHVYAHLHKRHGRIQGRHAQSEHHGNDYIVARFRSGNQLITLHKGGSIETSDIDIILEDNSITLVSPSVFDRIEDYTEGEEHD